MAKKDYFKKNKDVVVDGEVIDVEDIEVKANEAAAETNGIESRIEEEREKCEAMSHDDLVNYLLQTKENLWGSYDQREKLEESIEPLEKSNRELEKQVSELENDKKELIGKLEEVKVKIHDFELKAERVDELEKQLLGLEEQMENKDNAAKNMQFNLEKSHKKETEGLNETISQLKSELKDSKAEAKKLATDLKKAEKEITKLNQRTAEAESVNLEGISVKEMIKRMNTSVDEVNATFSAKREQLDREHREKIIETCEKVVTDSQREIITKQEIREAKIRAKRKLESKRAQMKDLDAEIAELEDFVEADEA